MRILFIGGTGVLSTDIVHECISRGHEVYLLNRGKHNDTFNGKCKILIGDIRNPESIKNILHNLTFDVVADFLSFQPDQIKSTIQLIENKCKQYIFVSSACCYRRAENDFPIVESSPKPISTLQYGIDKHRCELYLTSNNWPFHYTIVRPYITYGLTRIPTGIEPLPGCHGTIIARIRAGKPIFYWTDNKGKIPTCHITHTTDFAIGFCGLLLNDNAFDTDFNIVGDNIYSWKEIIKTISDIVSGGKSDIIEVKADDIASIFQNESQYFIGDRNLDAIFDNSKIKSVVPEFHDSISLRDGLSKSINHYNKHLTADCIDIRFDALCDRLLSSYGIQTRFINYCNLSLNQLIQYYKYRYLSNDARLKLTSVKRAISKFTLND